MNTRIFRLHWIVSTSLMAIICLLMVNYFGCNSLTKSVEESMEGDSYEMTEIDEVAAFLFSDSLTNADYINNINTAGLKIDTLSNFTFILGSSSTTFAQSNLGSAISLLITNGYEIGVNADSLYDITTGSTMDQGCFVLTPEKNNVIFYCDDYLTMTIYDESGNAIDPTSEVIPLELIAGCYELVNDIPTAIVKARYLFSLTQNNRYICVFEKNDQTTGDEFKCVVLGE